MAQALENSTSTLGPRDRFHRFVVMACSEISLLSAILLIFVIYNLGQSILLAAFSIAVLLVGSLVLRRGLAEAQIVLILSLLIMEVVVWLNIHFTIPIYGGIGPEILPPAFILLDAFVLLSILRLAGDH